MKRKLKLFSLGAVSLAAMPIATIATIAHKKDTDVSVNNEHYSKGLLSQASTSSRNIWNVTKSNISSFVLNSINMSINKDNAHWSVTIKENHSYIDMNNYGIGVGTVQYNKGVKKFFAISGTVNLDCELSISTSFPSPTPSGQYSWSNTGKFEVVMFQDSPDVEVKIWGMDFTNDWPMEDNPPISTYLKGWKPSIMDHFFSDKTTSFKMLDGANDNFFEMGSKEWFTKYKKGQTFLTSGKVTGTKIEERPKEDFIPKTYKYIQEGYLNIDPRTTFLNSIIKDGKLVHQDFSAVANTELADGFDTAQEISLNFSQDITNSDTWDTCTTLTATEYINTGTPWTLEAWLKSIIDDITANEDWPTLVFSILGLLAL